MSEAQVLAVGVETYTPLPFSFSSSASSLFCTISTLPLPFFAYENRVVMICNGHVRWSVFKQSQGFLIILFVLYFKFCAIFYFFVCFELEILFCPCQNDLFYIPHSRSICLLLYNNKNMIVINSVCQFIFELCDFHVIFTNVFLFMDKLNTNAWREQVA